MGLSGHSSATTTMRSIVISCVWQGLPAGGIAVWAYRLKPNHVHLILTPQTPEGLGRALGKAHRRYFSPKFAFQKSASA